MALCAYMKKNEHNACSHEKQTHSESCEHGHHHQAHAHNHTKHDHDCEHKHSHQSAHAHHHGHSHHHHHAHGVVERMSWAFFLNLIFAIIELIGGWMTNSLAVMSDAIHDFGDALAIGVAWYLEKKSHRESDDHFSYGYRRLSVVAAIITGVILMCGSILVVVRAVPRLLEPQQPQVEGMFALALLGLAVNGFAAWRMSRGSSLSERMILVHLLEDVLGWAMILIGSIVMWIHPIPILDPIMALAVALWVMWNAFHNLKETLQVILQATPGHLQQGKIEQLLSSFSQVSGVHHTHVWSLDGEQHILTTHVIVHADVSLEQAHELKNKLKHELHEQFDIREATIEIEWAGQACHDPHHA